MHKITVADDVGRQMTWSAGEAIVCDATGRVLGFFSPLRTPVPVEDLQLESPTPPEEIERRRQNPTGKPLVEILARLGLA